MNTCEMIAGFERELFEIEARREIEQLIRTTEQSEKDLGRNSDGG